ncbi:YadA-like family protein, partial [Psychrobacter celer]
GSVAANSQDAVNGGQLFNTAESVKNVIGGNAINTEGVITTTNIGGTGSNTIDGAITNVKDAATKAKTTVTEGENIVVTESTNLDGSTDYEVKTKRDLALDSVTTGNTVTNNDGVTITDGSNITAVTSTGTNVK